MIALSHVSSIRFHGLPGRTGAGLLVTFFTVAFSAAMLAVIFSVTTNSGRVTKRMSDRAMAAAYGEGVIESLFDGWRNRMLNAEASSGGLGVTTEQLAGVTAPSAEVIPAPYGVAASSARVVSATPMLAKLETGRPVPESGAGNRSRLNYVAETTITFPTIKGNEEMTLRRVFVRGSSSLFDYFFFGTRPVIEFHPGAPMYVDGEGYVEGDFFTGHNQLHLLDKVEFTGNHVLGYSTNDLRNRNNSKKIEQNAADDTWDSTTPAILSDNWSKENEPKRGPEQKIFDTKREDFDPYYMAADTTGLSPDTNLNNDGPREIIEELNGTGDDPLVINPSADPSEGRSYRLSKNADYQIEVDAMNAVQIFTQVAGVKTALSPTSTDYLALKAAIRTNTAIRDPRDGDNVRTITMDVSVLYDKRVDLQDRVNNGDGLAVYVKDTSQGQTVDTMIADPGYPGDPAIPGTPYRPEVPYQPAVAAVPEVPYRAAIPYKAAVYKNGKLVTAEQLAQPEIPYRPGVPGRPEVPYQPAIPAVAQVPATPPGFRRASSARQRAVKLVNGGRLPHQGLTVATPHAVYIQGDYNSGMNGATQPGSNTATSYTPPGDKPSPVVANYNKVPAAVVGDSINILSNAWKDENSMLARDSRARSSSTTINCALLGGNVASSSSSYSGGIENFIRLHENWSDDGSVKKYLTIKGTLALLYASKDAVGLWGSAEYSPPNRRWYYDQDFRNSTPPGFLPGAKYERGHWLTRQ